MFTPMSTASTAAGPLAATSGTSTSTAGRLFTRLASTAATAAIPSSASRSVPSGTIAVHRRRSPLTMTACTTTPSASTKTRNGTLHSAGPGRTEVLWRCARLRARQHEHAGQRRPGGFQAQERRDREARPASGPAPPGRTPAAGGASSRLGVGAPAPGRAAKNQPEHQVLRGDRDQPRPGHQQT